MNITIDPRKVLAANIIAILIIMIFSTLVNLLRICLGHNSIYGIIQLFDVNGEANIPALFSTLTLTLSSVLLMVISFGKKKNHAKYLSWAILATIFLLLSIDEFVCIHERFGDVFHYALNTSGLFLWAWVIPYGIFVLLFVLSYLKFLISLPRNAMRMFVLSGFLYVLGALIFEMLGARTSEMYGTESLSYLLIFSCEECLEMVGIAVFIYTLLTYIRDEFKSLAIAFSHSN